MQKIVVIGLGRFGSTLALGLTEGGAEVLAVDRNARLVEAVAERTSVAVGFDATEVENLRAYDVGKMDAAIVAVGSNFEASVLITMHCKSLGVDQVYAKALNEMQAAVLAKVGADHVIRPEEDMGRRLAEHLLHNTKGDIVELPEGFSLRRIRAPREWAGKTLEELNLRSTRKLSLIQILRPLVPAPGEAKEPREFAKTPLPGGEAVIEAGDMVDVIGPDGELGRYS